MHTVDKEHGKGKKYTNSKCNVGRRRKLIVCYSDHVNRKRHYKLDGYYVDEHGREHALEFNGCWYHGCPRCFPRDWDTLMIQGKSLCRRFSKTLNKKKFWRN